MWLVQKQEQNLAVSKVLCKQRNFVSIFPMSNVVSPNLMNPRRKCLTCGMIRTNGRMNSKRNGVFSDLAGICLWKQGPEFLMV